MPIDRAILEQHLTLADHHVAQGTEHVARQRELVAKLERGGPPLLHAIDTLAQFQQLLDLHIADRDRLRRELGLQGDVLSTTQLDQLGVQPSHQFSRLSDAVVRAHYQRVDLGV
jgi:hypothetical protein